MVYMMTESRIILQAEQLKITRSDKEVLGGVSFNVTVGEVYALLGGNGAGKSTTLLSFLGFLSPTAGHVRVKGEDVANSLESTREAIAYLPESASLYEHLNARENLHYFLQLAHVASDDSAIEAALDRVSLSLDARNDKLRYYSKGMRQKVAIAMSILRDTDILLLDEPTSGLDPGAIDEFHTLVRDLADTGKTILMVTHDVYGACQVADRIGLLRGGMLVGEFSASPDGGHANYKGRGRIDTDVVHRAFSGSNASGKN